MPVDLSRQTAHRLADAYRSGELTAVQAAQECLGRIDEVEPKIAAFLDVWNESALAQAEAVDEQFKAGNDLGPLAGIPIALKDVICTTEGATTCGSQILKGFHSLFDATVVTKLKAAGAVFLGKLNMDEFAMGSSTENSSYQVTRNPWNTDYVPGGSSGGSAAAVAAGESPVSLGSDTGGSIRQPAACCGCVGMKPTYGRVSRFGLVAYASSLDQIGPFARDTRDVASLLNVICGRDAHDSTSADLEVPDFTKALDRGVEGVAIGLPKEYFTDALSAEVRDSVQRAVAHLESLGAKTVEVSLPHTEYTVAAYYIIAMAEASANLARFDGVRYGYRAPEATDTASLYRLSKSNGFGEEVKRRILIGTYVLSSGYYDAYYLKAQKVRTLIQRDFTRAFESCDVLATPIMPTPPFKIGERTGDPMEMYLSDVYTTSANLAGIPGISVPCGLSSAGLPLGLQLLGKPFDEETLLQTASAYERTAETGVTDPPL